MRRIVGDPTGNPGARTGRPVQSSWAPGRRLHPFQIERGMGKDSQEWLLVQDADGTGAQVALAAASLKIGRAPDNQVVLTDSYASAAHAELVNKKGRRWLQDLGSTNGTRLNGQPVPPRKPY